MLVLPAAVLGGAALALTGGGDDVAARVVALALVYIAYFTIMAGIALIVSARARSSRAALLILLGCWAGNSLIAPRALSDISRSLEPTPSALTFNHRLETQLARESEGASEMLIARLMRQFRVTSADSLPFNIAGITLQAGETRGNRVFDAGYGALHDAFSAQSRWQRLGAALAPLTAVRFLSMGLSGTDYDQHWDFARSAEQYRRTLIYRMNMAVAFAPRDQGGAPPVGDAKLWASVAPFAYDTPTVSSILEREQASLIVLLAWVVLVAAGAYYASKRMPIDVTARSP
jgi:ABC-2 type transport system permease protein